LREEGKKEHKGDKPEKFGLASIVSVARQHSRIAERDRAICHHVRNSGFIGGRDLAFATAPCNWTEKRPTPSQTHKLAIARRLAFWRADVGRSCRRHIVGTIEEKWLMSS
jgi:hypothetical protein